MRWTAAAALLAGLALTGTADAATTYCVGFTRDGCTSRATAAEAFDDARDDDRIELGAISTAAPLSSSRAITVVGVGATAPVLSGGLALSDPGAVLSDAVVHDLRLAGTASRVRVEGLAELRGDALLQAATVRGDRGIDAAGGEPRLDTVLLELTGGAGLRVRCDATLHARHVTLAGTPDAAVTTACDTAVARIGDSILWGPETAGFTGPGRVVTDHTDHRPVAGHAAGPGDRSVDPGFVPGTARLAPGSPLVDAGAADPLAATAWPEDRDGLPRIADGNGDGTPVRDPGAFELAPAPVPPPAGNLLDDPGAEAGGGWAYTGGFTRERYGTFPFPSAAAGLALGAGSTFFAGGPQASATAQQTVRVVRVAPEIDLGRATVALAALLGGYRLDPDRGVVEARFLGPGGRALASLALETPTAAERANVTGLLPRARSAAVPRLTRAIVVTMRASRPSDQARYDDAYFDNVALTLAAPGAPPLSGGRRRHFSGARVLTARPTLDRRGLIRVRIGCPDRTVGRCAGALTLARAPAGRAPEPLAAARLTVPAGRARAVPLRAPPMVKRALRGRRRVRMRLYLAARDRLGTVRTATVPIVVRRASGRAGRRPGSSPGTPGTPDG